MLNKKKLSKHQLLFEISIPKSRLIDMIFEFFKSLRLFSLPIPKNSWTKNRSIYKYKQNLVKRKNNAETNTK